MNESKPVVTISLIPRTEPVRWELGNIMTIRKDGPDIWSIQLTITTTEGHVTQHSFTDYSKEVALAKAYAWLEKYTISQWFRKFYQQQYELNREIFKRSDEMELRFKSRMMEVSKGTATREDFLKNWGDHVALFEHIKADKAPGSSYDPRMDERCDPPEPPPKWRFRDWFK